MLQKISTYFGPSTLVTAAFIGPGTLTVCTLAGVSSGYTLLWAMVFSVAATIILQEMTARLGLITQSGFGEAIRKEVQQPIAKWSAILLVMGAIVIGNAAYEGGNISGAALGFEELIFDLGITVNHVHVSITPLFISLIAFIVIYLGVFKLIERFLITLVVIMSAVFVTTAIVVQPDIGEIFRGMFVPSIPAGELLLVVAIVGTTVVPYNLFLHASIVRKKYSSPNQLSDLRKENATAILLGGFISMCIIITSATTLLGETGISNAADMAQQLKPLLGNWSSYFLGTGLFAAGISSAITAPLAAGYAAKGMLGWEGDMKSTKFRIVSIGILLLGTLSSMFGISPIVVIQFAQVANGILLPVVAIFLIYLMNKSSLLGEFKNSLLQNVLGGVVILVTVILGIRSLNAVFQFL